MRAIVGTKLDFVLSSTGEKSRCALTGRICDNKFYA